MATEVWLIFPVLFVMLVSGLVVFHPRFRNSRPAKVVNLVVAAVCFAAIVALVIIVVTSF
jgi:cytochrome b subunit of formate dehydrogenase